MSILNFANIKALRDHFLFKSSVLVGSGNSIAAGATFQSSIFNIKKSALTINIRFSTTAPASAKLTVQLAGYDDQDTAIWLSGVEEVTRIAGQTYASLAFETPVKRIRVTVINTDSADLTATTIVYGETDRVAKVEHQVFLNRDLVAVDNVSPKFRISKSLLNINLFWVTEPSAYTLYARFYDKNGNLISINPVHTGTVANAAIRRMVSTNANAETVDFNLRLEDGQTGRIRSLLVKETDAVMPSSEQAAVKIDQTDALSKLVFPSTALAAGATITSEKITLVKSNHYLTWTWQTRPTHFKVQAYFYRNNSVVEIVDIFERKLGLGKTYYTAPFQKRGDIVEIRITNSSSAAAQLAYATITQLDTPMVDDTFDNVYEHLNNSVKVTLMPESAGYDSFYNAQRVQLVNRPDFYNSVFSKTKKETAAAVNDYIFLQSGAKELRAYLVISDIVGNPFPNETDGVTLSVVAGEYDKPVEITLLSSGPLKAGTHILIFGKEHEGVLSTGLIFGDRLMFRLTFAGDISAANNFNFELFTYSKF